MDEQQISGWETFRLPQRNHTLDGGAHWRHLANVIKRSVRGSDAVLCQITLVTCCYYYQS